eukprot:1104805_1
MRRLGIEDEMVWLFPTPDILLRVYLVDCARIRKQPNCWGTIRNKLRSIDYIAQLTGCMQSWSKNPSIAAQCACCKKQNKSSMASTLPITAAKLKQIVVFVMRHKVYGGLRLTASQKVLRDQGLIFNKIWRDEKRMFWYVLCVSWMINGTLGLRGVSMWYSIERLRGTGTPESETLMATHRR